MRALVRSVAAVSLMCMSADATVRVVAQEPTLRTRVDVVTIDAYVQHDGRPLEGLVADDFVVRDNGVVQTIRAIGTTDSAHVIVALDVSGSVAGDVQARLGQALRRLRTHLAPVDRVSLLTFADRVRIHHVAEVPTALGFDDLGQATSMGATARPGYFAP